MIYCDIAYTQHCPDTIAELEKLKALPAPPIQCADRACLNRELLAILRERVTEFTFQEIASEVRSAINLPPRKFSQLLRDVTASVLMQP